MKVEAFSQGRAGRGNPRERKCFKLKNFLTPRFGPHFLTIDLPLLFRGKMIKNHPLNIISHVLSSTKLKTEGVTNTHQAIQEGDAQSVSQQAREAWEADFHGSYNCASQCVLQRFELKVVTVVFHQDKVIAAI